MESKNTESKIQVNPEALATVPESLAEVCGSPMGILIEYRDDIHKNYWSPNVYSILSMKVEEGFIPTVGAILRNVHPADKVYLSEIIQAIKDRSLVNYQTITFRYRAIDNASKNLCLTIEPQLTSNGIPEYWMGTVKDVSKVKQRIENAENFSSSIFEILDRLPYLVSVLDSKGAYTYWNKSSEYVSGFKSNEIIGQRDLVKRVFPEPELRARFRTAVKDSYSRPVNIEVELTTKKGEKRLIAWTIYSNISKNDNWSTVAIGSDISKVRLAEETKELYIRKLESLANLSVSLLSLEPDENYFHHLGTSLETSVGNCLFVVNSIDESEHFLTIDGIYGFTSEEWEYALEILGWNPVGRRFQIPNEIVEGLKDMQAHLVGKSIYEVSDGVVSSVTARGIERTFSVENIYAIGIISNGKLVGLVNIFSRKEEFESELNQVEEIINLYARAFTRRNTESSIRAKIEQVEESDRLKTAYLGNFGHEIRTPLNAILGFTQLLNIPNLAKDKRKQYIDIINSKGKMLVKLINDLVDASKVDSGQITLVKSVFNLNQLMRSLMAFYQNERVFQQREAVEIMLSLPDSSDLFELYSDEGRLEQVFTNLLDNALKFTEKGFIEFGYLFTENSVKFFVRDTGIGIDEKLHSVIFDRYKQIEENIVRTKEGKGLGLAISKGIVELLGGSIWVESKQGAGATFLFTIPIIESEVEAIPEETNNDSKLLPDWKNRVVMVVEDEEINYLYICELLTQCGATIIWAKDGAQAVELVANIKNIDVILMDIRMPIMDGYAATLEIRQINPNIPIIAQTAYAYTEDRAKAEAAGCNDYITKPINTNELLEIIGKYLK